MAERQMTVRGREASQRQAVLGQAASILDQQADDIVLPWMRRLQAELYPQRQDLGLQGLRDSAPLIVQAVAEALRGQPLSAEAAWTEPARRHAQTRLLEGVPLSNVMGEFQMLRQEMWRVLGQQLGGIAAQAVFDLAGALDSALDVMAAVSVGAFSRQVQQMAARLLEKARGYLEAALRQMPSGVIIAEAPSGALILCNERAERIWRQPLPLLADMQEYARWEGYHADGRRYRPGEWLLSRSLQTGQVITGEEIRIGRGDGT